MMKLEAHFFKRQLPLIFLVIMMILGIRSTIIEPFRIPTRSMLPGLMMGDFLFANKFEYGFDVNGGANAGKEPQDMSKFKDSLDQAV